MQKFNCILIIIIYFTKQIQCQIKKCCPEDFVLDTKDFYCGSSENENVWDSYNIKYNNLMNLENCVRKTRNAFGKEEAYAELNGCIDKDLNDTFVAVSCQDTPGVNVGVHFVKKCCPIGQSYDHSKRNCVLDPNSHETFKSLFGNSVVVFERNIPECSREEVFVEYSSTAHSIRFSEKNVKVNGNILPSDKFCIEDLINIDPNEATTNEHHVIVRSCRPRSICNEISCIRRCCSADQIMLNRPKSERCQPHPNNTNLMPIFYDITFPLSDTQKKKPIRGMMFFYIIFIKFH